MVISPGLLMFTFSRPWRMRKLLSGTIAVMFKFCSCQVLVHHDILYVIKVQIIISAIQCVVKSVYFKELQRSLQLLLLHEFLFLHPALSWVNHILVHLLTSCALTFSIHVSFSCTKSLLLYYTTIFFSKWSFLLTCLFSIEAIYLYGLSLFTLLVFHKKSLGWLLLSSTSILRRASACEKIFYPCIQWDEHYFLKNFLIMNDLRQYKLYSYLFVHGLDNCLAIEKT